MCGAGAAADVFEGGFEECPVEPTGEYDSGTQYDCLAEGDCEDDTLCSVCHTPCHGNFEHGDVCQWCRYESFCRKCNMKGHLDTQGYCRACNDQFDFDASHDSAADYREVRLSLGEWRQATGMHGLVERCCSHYYETANKIVYVVDRDDAPQTIDDDPSHVDT